MLPNTSSLASAYETNGKMKKGSRIRSATTKSDMTLLRESGMNEIYANAQAAGLTVDQYITKMLCNSSTELRAYVMSKGETPMDDCVSLGIQAALLRAADIGHTSFILGTDDETALQNIEQAEQDLITLNSPDRDLVLTVPTQAALACVLEFLHQNSGQNMSAFIKTFQGAAKTAIKAGGVNHLDDYGDPSNTSDWTDWLSDGSFGSDPTQTAAADNSYNYSSIGTGLAAISGPGTGDISVASNIPTITSGPSGGTTAGQTSAGGVLNGILSVINGVTSVANAVTGAANASAGAAGAVKNAVSNVGANSIATYINNNKSTIIMVVAIIVIAILITIYASRK